jgi:hypothetical protein
MVKERKRQPVITPMVRPRGSQHIPHTHNHDEEQVHQPQLCE